MADNTNLNQVVGNIGKFGTDYSNSMRTANERMRYLGTVASNLGRTSKQVTSSLADSSEKLSKFNQAINSTAESIAAMTGKSSKLGFAVSASTKTISSVLGSFLEVTDNILKLNDTVAQYGVGVENSAKDIVGIANSAGYWSGIAEKFSKQVELAGSDLLALAPTTGRAVKRFGSIFNVAQIKGGALAIMKLGYTPETFNKAQVDYIKLQAAYGLKVERDDNKLRTATMDYALTIAKLSSLTGESKDEISQKMASQALDFKYQAERRKLVKEGKEKQAIELDKATILINSQLGPDIMKGVNDMIANGTATTKEGEGVMLATQNQAAKWAEQVKNGEMSGVEYARKVARAYDQFIRTNKEALRVSEAFRKQVGVTGKTFRGIEMGEGMENDATVEKLLKDSQAAKDTAKELQASAYEIQRNANIAVDRMVVSSSGLLYDAFKVFANFVTRIAYGAAGFGKMLAPSGSDAEKAFQKVQDILGTKEDAIASVNKVDKELKETEDQIKKHGKYTEDYIKFSADYHAAQKEKNKLLADKQKGKKIDEKALEKYMKQEEESWKQITAILARERKMFGGVTSQTLVYKKKELLERKKDLEVNVRVKTEEEREGKRRDAAREESRVEERKQQEELREGKEVTPSGPKDPALYKGLRFKDFDENTGGGPDSPNLIAVAKKISELYKVTFTAFNDRFHQKHHPRSKHTKGTAMDFSVFPAPKNREEAAAIKQRLLQIPGVAKVYDEYFADRGQYTTGGHFHVEIDKFKLGGISKGPASGYKVELHGTEAVIPMLDGKTIPIELKLPDQKADFTDIKKEITYRLSPLKEVKVPELKSKSSVEPYDDSVEFELISKLLGKIESMTKQFETSNSIQSNLKLYLSN
jgi:hypothetical protein